MLLVTGYFLIFVDEKKHLGCELILMTLNYLKNIHSTNNATKTYIFLDVEQCYILLALKLITV